MICRLLHLLALSPQIHSWKVSVMVAILKYGCEIEYRQRHLYNKSLSNQSWSTHTNKFQEKLETSSGVCMRGSAGKDISHLGYVIRIGWFKPCTQLQTRQEWVVSLCNQYMWSRYAYGRAESLDTEGKREGIAVYVTLYFFGSCEALQFGRCSQLLVFHLLMPFSLGYGKRLGISYNYLLL